METTPALPTGWTWKDNDRPEVRAHTPRVVTKALDVGCGLGAFATALRTDRPSAAVFGIEPNEQAAEHAAGNLEGVACGLFPQDLPKAWSGFDLVTFNDSLEHMPDPWAALRAAVDVSVPGGTIMASIPNVRFLDVSINLLARGRWEYQDDGVLDRTHLRFFTRQSAIQLFQSAGLEPDLVLPLHVEKGATHLTARVLRAFGPLFHNLLAPQYLLVAHRP